MPRPYVRAAGKKSKTLNDSNNQTIQKPNVTIKYIRRTRARMVVSTGVPFCSFAIYGKSALALEPLAGASRLLCDP